MTLPEATLIAQSSRKYSIAFTGNESIHPVRLKEYSYADCVDNTALDIIATYKCFLAESERLAARPNDWIDFSSFYAPSLAEADNYLSQLISLRDSLSTTISTLQILQDAVHTIGGCKK